MSPQKIRRVLFVDDQPDQIAPIIATLADKGTNLNAVTRVRDEFAFDVHRVSYDYDHDRWEPIVEALSASHPAAYMVDLGLNSRNKGDLLSGMRLAAKLKLAMPSISVGVYTRLPLDDQDRVSLSMQGFRIVIENLLAMVERPADKITPGWWLDVLRGLTNPRPRARRKGDRHVEDTPASSRGRSIFIAHATKDAKVVASLNDLLTAAFANQVTIHAAAVPGNGFASDLPLASTIEEKVADSGVVLVLLTAQSIGAAYVWYEAGLGHDHASVIPLVVHADMLEAFRQTPLGHLPAKVLERRDAVLELIELIQNRLGATTASSAKWIRYIDALQESA